MDLEELIEKKIKLEQFNFLKKKKYKLYGFQKSNFLSPRSQYNSNIDVIYASKEKQPTLRNFDLICEIKTAEELLKHITQQAIIVDNENDNKKFFLSFLFSNLPLQKTVLKNHHIFIHNFKLNNYFKDFITFYNFRNISEFTTYFSKTFTNTFWSINSVDLNEMHNSLISKWDKEDVFKFWMRFFKSRKNQINDPKYSKKIYDFIFSIYKDEESKLYKFGNFFKYLRAKFDEPQISIFEDDTHYSIHFSLNLKKMINCFFIDNFLANDYFKKTEQLCYSLAKYHNISHCEIFKRKNIVSINFYQYENTLKEEEIKDSITTFFKYLKENHVNYIEESQILKWLDFYYLNKNLSHNEIKSKIFTKI